MKMIAVELVAALSMSYFFSPFAISRALHSEKRRELHAGGEHLEAMNPPTLYTENADRQ
jgi:hypothetical protein